MINIDIQRVAEEVKAYISKVKMDLIDYSLEELEAYPPPDNPNYPEIKKLSLLWSDFFDDSDKAMVAVPDDKVGEGSFGDALSKVSPELEERLKELDRITEEVASTVNSDSAFWEELRAAVIPLYERSPDYEGWKERWKSIELAYDPCPLKATTTQMWTNKETGERTRGEVVSTTEYPQGFIVKIL